MTANCTQCGNEIEMEHHSLCSKCRISRIKNQYRCCEKAEPLSCVCYQAWQCPEHGETHIGTHD